MKFKHKNPKTYYRGDIRTKKRFLLFPIRIRNLTRWLEIAEWTETYSITFGWIKSYWIDI